MKTLWLLVFLTSVTDDPGATTFLTAESVPFTSEKACVEPALKKVENGSHAAFFCQKAFQPHPYDEPK